MSCSRKRQRSDVDHVDSPSTKFLRTLEEGSDAVERQTSLRIVTDSASLHRMQNDDTLAKDTDDVDSLFDDSPSPHPAGEGCDAAEPTAVQSTAPDHVNTPLPARRTAPPIPGLYFDPALCLPPALAEDVMWTCIRMYFQKSAVDQVMLFERASSPGRGLPRVLIALLATLADLLRPLLPPEKHTLLFPSEPTGCARQAILNLYWPGGGIIPHVDLLDRYGDGIIGVSFGSGCVMQFAKVLSGRGDEPMSQRVDSGTHGEGQQHGLYLPSGSVLVLTEEARYGWTHGIEERMEDEVECEDKPGTAGLLPRDIRLSITFRWLLPGADVVGGPVLQTAQDNRAH